MFAGWPSGVVRGFIDIHSDDRGPLPRQLAGHRAPDSARRAGHERHATVERPTEAVQVTGACNTFWLENDRVAGDNTDVEGVLRAVDGLMGDVAGANVLLLGAGGAARAVVAAPPIGPARMRQQHLDAAGPAAKHQQAGAADIRHGPV